MEVLGSYEKFIKSLCCTMMKMVHLCFQDEKASPKNGIKRNVTRNYIQLQEKNTARWMKMSVLPMLRKLQRYAPMPIVAAKKESEEDFPRYPNYCYYWDKMGNLTLPITHIMQDICSCRGTGSAICATVRNKSSGVGWKSLSFAHAPNSSTLKAQSSGTPSPVIIFKPY